jgi:hypothetical protein
VPSCECARGTNRDSRRQLAAFVAASCSPEAGSSWTRLSDLGGPDHNSETGATGRGRFSGNKRSPAVTGGAHCGASRSFRGGPVMARDSHHLTPLNTAILRNNPSKCRMRRLRPVSWLPRISLGLTIAQLSARLRCAECGGQLHCQHPPGPCCDLSDTLWPLLVSDRGTTRPSLRSLIKFVRDRPLGHCPVSQLGYHFVRCASMVAQYPLSQDATSSPKGQAAPCL